MAKTISSETWDWAQEWYRREVDELLDDPSSWGLEGTAFRDEVARLRRIGVDLDMDFDNMVQISGSEYEIDRLNNMLKEEP